MPFKTYYRHGAMLPTYREVDRQILGNFLNWGYGDRRAAITTAENPYGNKNSKLDMAFERLHAIGLIEAVPHLPGRFRIPPHLVKAVGKFVGKPKK